ncbi:MAG: hypothetical protein LBN34_06155 [Clostridiales Family XIII bacterium]|jgi:hypothetical protein|nr:hypothetical protein [Clostridiales Family XIII bacterium]
MKKKWFIRIPVFSVLVTVTILNCLFVNDDHSMFILGIFVSIIVPFAITKKDDTQG